MCVNLINCIHMQKCSVDFVILNTFVSNIHYSCLIDMFQAPARSFYVYKCVFDRLSVGLSVCA